MACDNEGIPLQVKIETVADDTNLAEVCNTARHLLYVACTRARDHLPVTSVTPGSEFLDELTIPHTSLIKEGLLKQTMNHLERRTRQYYDREDHLNTDFPQQQQELSKTDAARSYLDQLLVDSRLSHEEPGMK